MFGRLVDRAALAVLLTAGVYLLFLNAGLGIISSCGLTFIIVSLARELTKRRPIRRRVSPAQAEAALLKLVLEGDGEALTTLAGDSDAAVIFHHPDGTFTLNELFEHWRDGGDGTRLVVTCKADPEAVRFAGERGMALIDKTALLKAIRKTGRYVEEAAQEPPFITKLPRAWDKLRIRPRMLLYSVSLIGMYVVTGQGLYLICALGIMGVAGVKLIERYA